MSVTGFALELRNMELTEIPDKDHESANFRIKFLEFASNFCTQVVLPS